MDLEGRAFLHDYRSDDDPEGAILEAIMTGPMVVGHWINFQYYASTVDNTRYGCGDKVLHNIVGGHLGVLEGNGGDLRIGLSLQSLHDGERWVHVPLRLAVFIEASRAAIDGVLAKHPKINGLGRERVKLLPVPARLDDSAPSSRAGAASGSHVTSALYDACLKPRPTTMPRASCSRMRSAVTAANSSSCSACSRAAIRDPS